MKAVVLLSAALLSSLVSTSAFGQTTIQPPTLQPNTRPTTSPYLFLNNGGRNSAALNYYRQVRPQREFYKASQRQAQSIRTLGQDVSRLEQQLIVTERPPIGPTGHSTSFFNYGSYFGNSPTFGAAAGR